MARVKKTVDYLERLRNKGYKGYNDLLNLYNRWKEDLDFEAFSDFLDITWKEKDSIRPELGVNTYNNFRGIALEEFCFYLLQKTMKEMECEDAVELFWNQKILTEEFWGGSLDCEGSRDICG